MSLFESALPPAFEHSRCHVCHQEAQYACARCDTVHYCSHACQRRHWHNEHQHLCLLGSYLDSSSSSSSNDDDHRRTWTHEPSVSLSSTSAALPAIDLSLRAVDERLRRVGVELTAEQLATRQEVLDETRIGTLDTILGRANQPTVFSIHLMSESQYSRLVSPNRDLIDVKNKELFPLGYLAEIKDKRLSLLLFTADLGIFVGGIQFRFRTLGDTKAARSVPIQRFVDQPPNDDGSPQAPKLLFTMEVSARGRGTLKKFQPSFSIRETPELELKAFPEQSAVVFRHSEYDSAPMAVDPPIRLEGQSEQDFKKSQTPPSSQQEQDEAAAAGVPSAGEFKTYRKSYEIDRIDDLHEMIFLTEIEFFEINSQWQRFGLGARVLALWRDVVHRQNYRQSYAYLFAATNQQTINFYERRQDAFVSFERFLNSAQERDYIVKTELIGALDEVIEKDRRPLDNGYRYRYYVWSQRWDDNKDKSLPAEFEIILERKRKRTDELRENAERDRRRSVTQARLAMAAETRAFLRTLFGPPVREGELSARRLVRIRLVRGEMFFRDVEMLRSVTSIDKFALFTFQLIALLVAYFGGETTIRQLVRSQFVYTLEYAAQQVRFEGSLRAYDVWVKGMLDELERSVVPKNADLFKNTARGRRLSRIEGSDDEMLVKQLELALLIFHLKELVLDFNDALNDRGVVMRRALFANGGNSSRSLDDIRNMSAANLAEEFAEEFTREWLVLRPLIRGLLADERQLPGAAQIDRRFVQRIVVTTPYDTLTMWNDRIAHLLQQRVFAPAVLVTESPRRVVRRLHITVLDTRTLPLIDPDDERQSLLAGLDELIISSIDIDAGIDLSARVAALQQAFPRIARISVPPAVVALPPPPSDDDAPPPNEPMQQ